VDYEKPMNAGFSCYNVTPLPENFCSILFTTGYKRFIEGGRKVFALGAFALRLLLLACRFLAFWCGGFWKGRLLEEDH
jgi:hypothetical protein